MHRALSLLLAFGSPGLALSGTSGCADSTGAAADSLADPAADYGAEAPPEADGASVGDASPEAADSYRAETPSETGASSDYGADYAADHGVDYAADYAADGSQNPADVGAYAASGPHKVQIDVLSGPLAAYTLYYPADLQAGDKSAIISWGNGTGTTPIVYQGLLEHWASHGLVVIAANTPAPYTGLEMLAGIDWLLEEHERPGSVFEGALDPEKIATVGHSQGGGGAINAASDARVRTCVAIQPAVSQVEALKGPLLLLAGGLDTVVSPALFVEPLLYAPAQVPTVYGVLLAATHLTPTGAGGGFRGYATAWLKLHLSGDTPAQWLFYGDACGLCADEAWEVQRKNLPQR